MGGFFDFINKIKMKFAGLRNAYETRYVRVDNNSLKQDCRHQLTYVYELYKSNIIDESQYMQYRSSILSYKQHFSHPGIEVTITDKVTGEKAVHVFLITKSDKSVEIWPSGTEAAYGKSMINSEVHKIDKNLAITSHSLYVGGLDLKTISYDITNNRLIEVENNFELTNVTPSNIGLLNQHLINVFESPDITVKRIDILSSGNAADDLVARKIMEDLYHNREEYQKLDINTINTRIDTISDNFYVFEEYSKFCAENKGVPLPKKFSNIPELKALYTIKSIDNKPGNEL